MLFKNKKLIKFFLLATAFFGVSAGSIISISQCARRSNIKQVSLQSVCTQTEVGFFNKSQYANEQDGQRALRDYVFAKNELYLYGDSSELSLDFSHGADTATLSCNKKSKHFTGSGVKITFNSPGEGQTHTDDGIYFNDYATTATHDPVEIDYSNTLTYGSKENPGNLQVYLGTHFDPIVEDANYTWLWFSSNPQIAQLIQVPGDSDKNHMQVITGEKTGQCTILILALTTELNVISFHALDIIVNGVNNTLKATCKFPNSDYYTGETAENDPQNTTAFSLTRNGINVIQPIMYNSGINISGLSDHYTCNKTHSDKGNVVNTVTFNRDPYTTAGTYTDNLQITQGVSTINLSYLYNLFDLATKPASIIVAITIKIVDNPEPFPPAIS